MTDNFIKKIILEDRIPQDNYLNCLPVVKHLINNDIEFQKPVTFFVGENGIGKSTLIEAIAVSTGFNPEGGTVNFNFSTRESHSDLYKYLKIAKGTRRRTDGFFLRAESFFNVASNIEEMDREPASAPPVIESYGGISLHEQSHGESFMVLVRNRFGGNGLYILDEPEAALSPSRLMTLLCEIHRLVNDNSQFIISTHSPILMAYPNADIYEITQNGINHVHYIETEHYRITREFLNNTDSMLNTLLYEQ